MLYHWAHSSQSFNGTMVFWNMGSICPKTQRNIRMRTESLVMPPWQTQILHNSWLHAIPHVNTQWHSQINTKRNNSMKQSSSWEANSSLASQEIPQILWKPKVCYNIHKHLPPFPILKLINPIRACLFHFLKIHFKIILPPMPRSSK